MSMTDNPDEERNENLENDTPEQENPEESSAESHFDSAYELKANESYEVNGYRYETDDRGRIEHCEGKLQLENGKRNPDHQRKAGGEDRLDTDDGDHLIAARFNGSSKVDNIVPMDAQVNRGDYKAMEEEWARELKKGNSVEVNIDVSYPDNGKRPDSIDVDYKVTEPDGTTWYDYKHFDNKKGA